MVTHGERAQLLLIGAVVVAVAILGTVALLNAIHIAPNANSQTDAQSVTSAERVNEGLENDLRELTLMHSSITEEGTPLPYVNQSKSFEDAVDNYTRQYNALASTASPAVASVTYSTGPIGAVAYQNETGPVADGTVLASTDSVPRLYVNATIETSNEYANISFRGVDVDVTPAGVFADGDRVGTCSVGTGTQVEVDVYSGNGTVRTDGSTCGELALPVSGTAEVQITTSGDSANGTYAISGVGSSLAGLDAENAVKNVDVNPRFQIVYQDSSVAYETEFSAYGGGS